MSCDRANEIDPAEYLATPRNPKFEAFRSHYLGCEDCSASVAEWSALVDAIRESGDQEAPHLESLRVVAFTESPNELGEAERVDIERHLAGCRSCADEVEVLRSFPFREITAMRPPAERTAVDRLAGYARDVKETLFPSPEGTSENIGFGALRARPDLAMAYQSQAEGGDEDSRNLIAMIAVVGGKYADAVYPLRVGRSTLGRHASCGIQIQDPDLERIELRFTTTPGKIELVSEHPGRPARVNGEPRESAALADGDEIEIGAHRFKIRMVDGRR